MTRRIEDEGDRGCEGERSRERMREQEKESESLIVDGSLHFLCHSYTVKLDLALAVTKK